MPLPVAILAAAIAAIAFFVLGGAVLGSGSTSSGPGPVARQAADAWLAARPFAGARTAGVPTNLARTGAIKATLQPGAQWHHDGRAGETFLVSVVNGPTLGLTVVTDGGKVAFSPTLTPLPFVIGRAPPAPAGSVATGGALPQPVATWLAGTFGPSGLLPPLIGFGLASPPVVLSSWAPAAGGTVLRIGLVLSSTAPGTPAARSTNAANAADAKVVADTRQLGADQGAAVQAGTALNNARAAAAGANPPNPPPLAAAVTTAQAALTNANAKVAVDRAALARDEQLKAATAGGGPAVSAASAQGTYDIWMRAQSVMGFAPAAYGVTG